MWPNASMTLRFSHDERLIVDAAAASLWTVSSTARPTIIEASSALEAVGDASPTTLPSRMTVMRSATSRTSRSLWVMNTIDAPDALSWRMISISSSVSCGVSTAVGSSNTSTLASRESALMISTRCCTPTGQILDQRVGVDVESEARRDLAHAGARGIQIEQSAGAGVLVTEHDVLGDGEDRDEHEVLVHHADSGAHRVAGAVEVLHVVVEQDDALVGRVQPVQDVHQRGLACAVLAEQAVDLARLDHEIDVVVRDEAAEPLRDPAEFELHGADPSDGGASTHRRVARVGMPAPTAVGRPVNRPPHHRCRAYSAR